MKSLVAAGALFVALATLAQAATAGAISESFAWIMMGLGFACFAALGLRKRKTPISAF